MKGQTYIIGIAAVVLILGALYFSGALDLSGSLFVIEVPDPNCNPGTLLLPEWGNYECKVSATKQTKSLTDGYQCGLYTCYDVYCGGWADYPNGEDCEVEELNNVIILQPSGPEPFRLSSGSSITLVLNPGIFQTPAVVIRYRPTFISYTETSTGFHEDIVGGCDLSRTNIGNERYEALPQDKKDFTLPLNSLINVPVRWQSYPYDANVVYYDSDYRTCRSTGQTRQLYNIEKQIVGTSCYYYEKNWYTEVECCPGDIRIDGVGCSPDLTWDEEGVNTGCCSGGFCSDIKCPGNGGWDWDGFYPWTDNTVKRYSCQDTTGICQVAEEKTAACNPFNNQGCSALQNCDPVSLTCVDKPVIDKYCTELGYECCLAGMFPNVKDVRTCEDAGKPGYICVQGFCYPPSPGNCNHNGICDTIIGENEANCPEDCAIPMNFNWLWIPILAALFGLILYLLSDKDVVGGLIGVIIGAIAGGIIWWLLALAWWQQLLLGAGLFLGLGVGIWLLFFAGGGVIILAIITIMRR